ncbi:ferrous iron transport protein B [Xylophilus ampelinus]|uniref:Ferrous iron transport protein B n=1 Tax=Xylophilus ampelinus TaxID=54067 RepID=A0A318SD85_9BURK|nr:ferrous iron transport protein B [Xylophilus ampelinus]MCS4511781.1 ferrous iron transport protein B [Xylophilus ampelinus]PYE73425.1 ferrous iron transport protein B [Xylophilus ampelinus]
MSAAGALRVALLGNPNCGKTALFNLLTGSRAKVANYAGVTVERKVGRLRTPSGRQVQVLDLPGAYSLNAMSADEAVTRDIVTGQRPGEPLPDLLVCVTDATNLRLNLRLVLEARELGLPLVMALNMSDMARSRGIVVDTAVLSRELGMPVIETVGIRGDGAAALVAALETYPAAGADVLVASGAVWQAPALADVQDTQAEVRRILAIAVQEPATSLHRDDAIDRVVLHPLWGTLLLAVLLFLMFQAVFSWAEVPMEAIKGATEAAAEFVKSHVPDGILQSLLADGIVAGLGGVVVFLPQILILFLFILALEDSGYLPRAAFMLDRLMGTVGLSGRSFIPLLSSFACAIPGVMAARTITNWRDRLVTIMIAPLMTCSARLPVYALLIAAFIPTQTVGGVFNLQGVVLFVLYVGGIVSAMAVAWVFKRMRGTQRQSPLLMELPPYRWPNPRQLAIGLWERAMIFMKRVGTMILALTVLLWFFATFPSPPEGATGPAIQYSLAGMIGRALEVVFAPIGFNWQISIALVPGLAAREVAVGALGTVYAMSATGEDAAAALEPLIAANWPFATAVSLLVWYVFAPMCLSTLATVKRETNSWRYALIMAGYLFALAYVASFVAYRVALALS